MPVVVARSGSIRSAFSAALLALVAFASSAFAEGEPKDVAPPSASSQETYKQLELFARVLSYVENNYVEPVDQKKLIYGAIKGMMDTLDPHTVFLTPEDFRSMRVDTSGEFGGLGIEIA